MSVIKLSSGVEISEETVVAALKKVGIETNPPEPKHVFVAGDVAQYRGMTSTHFWRFIIEIDGKLHSVDASGRVIWTTKSSTVDQDYFESNEYKFIGRLKDLLKN